MYCIAYSGTVQRYYCTVYKFGCLHFTGHNNSVKEELINIQCTPRLLDLNTTCVMNSDEVHPDEMNPDALDPDALDPEFEVKKISFGSRHSAALTGIYLHLIQ